MTVRTLICFLRKEPLDCIGSNKSSRNRAGRRCVFFRFPSCEKDALSMKNMAIYVTTEHEIPALVMYGLLVKHPGYQDGIKLLLVIFSGVLEAFKKCFDLRE